MSGNSDKFHLIMFVRKYYLRPVLQAKNTELWRSCAGTKWAASVTITHSQIQLRSHRGMWTISSSSLCHPRVPRPSICATPACCVRSPGDLRTLCGWPEQAPLGTGLVTPAAPFAETTSALCSTSKAANDGWLAISMISWHGSAPGNLSPAGSILRQTSVVLQGSIQF